ncbi:MAG TPA: alpha/beta hydrolase [Streptosporangiaceae bacterium]
MPVGYLFSVGVVAICTAVALVGPRPAQSTRSHPSFWLTYLINEQPFLAFYWLLAITVFAIVQGDLASPGGKAACGVAILTAIGLAVLVWRALRAGPALERALADGLGPDWRARTDAVDPASTGSGRWWPIGRLLAAPFLVRRRDVVRVANLRYGDAGKRNMLDVYHQRARPVGGPTLVFLHGGGFRSGHKNREGRVLLNRLASQGWVCVSANYRLEPEAGFPSPLIDVKQVIAWVRAHAGNYGGDPRTLFVAGSSAGAHLASMAGLTPNDRMFQPGFESADTSITAVICFYGYYGRLGGPHDATSSPLDRLHRDAPPFFVIHGDKDSLIPVGDARTFVARLRALSTRPVVYAELPGAQHAFDLFHSVRYAKVVNAVEAFATWVRASQRQE